MTFSAPPTAAALWALGLMPFACHAQTWNGASNALAAGLPALAAYSTWHHHDTEGGKQLALTLATTLGSTLVLKSQINALRPNGADNHSMPSGHTAMAFAATRFMHERYGANWHPALVYSAASLVGFARVRANQHHWRDVIAGATLGHTLGSLATTPYAAADTSAHLVVLPQTGGLWASWYKPW
jgi:membrane-associated phospholipid phosphatase